MGLEQQEFESINLDTLRQNQRAVQLAKRLGQQPGASVPAAFENCKDPDTEGKRLEDALRPLAEKHPPQ